MSYIVNSRKSPIAVCLNMNVGQRLLLVIIKAESDPRELEVAKSTNLAKFRKGDGKEKMVDMVPLFTSLYFLSVSRL